MSNVGETLFDRSSDNHEEIWDDTELIRAYDRAHRQIQNRLRNTPKAKKDISKTKNLQSNHKQKTKKVDITTSSPSPLSTVATSAESLPTPIPLNMITPPKNEQDAFHSMLTSWYMAGYHAGQLAAKNQKKNT
ncbi:hypothetical protein I4U23_014483 [Adineta vaga]|nr:hypothetical protein I4U23_014483 [Adineta vaga]